MSSEVVDFHIWFSPGFLMQLRQARQESFRCIARPNSSSASILLDSFFSCIFLRSFRRHFKTIGGTEMANVKQTQKMIPFITCEASSGQHVSELVLGVNLFDLDLWFYIDSVEQPINRNSVGPGNMSHCTTSSL